MGPKVSSNLAGLVESVYGDFFFKLDSPFHRQNIRPEIDREVARVIRDKILTMSKDDFAAAGVTNDEKQAEFYRIWAMAASDGIESLPKYYLNTIVYVLTGVVQASLSEKLEEWASDPAFLKAVVPTENRKMLTDRICDHLAEALYEGTFSAQRVRYGDEYCQLGDDGQANLPSMQAWSMKLPENAPVLGGPGM
jgi:hypothetical protein